MSENEYGSGAYAVSNAAMIFISFMCGYPGIPAPGHVFEVLQRCLSLPGRMGYIPALMLLSILASEGGTSVSFYPVPFYAVGRITGVCAVEGKVIETRVARFADVLGFESSYVPVRLRETREEGRVIQESVMAPEGFGVLIKYQDLDGREVRRGYLVARSQVHGRFVVVEAPDAVVEALEEICRAGLLVMKPQEYYEELQARLGEEEVRREYLYREETRELVYTGEPEVREAGYEVTWEDEEEVVEPEEIEGEEEEEEL